jgi:LacI family repressor for deo operon, udp, cdd, tsx, nupC, and nupG
LTTGAGSKILLSTTPDFVAAAWIFPTGGRFALFITRRVALFRAMNLPSEGGASAPDPVLTAGADASPIKPITMAMIARAAGVSQGAISSLLNDRDYGIRVSDKTRERVFRVCRELGYVPNDLRAFVRMYPEQGDTCLLVSARIPGGMANSFVARVAGAVTLAAGGIAVALYDEAREYSADGGDSPAPVRNGTASRFICIGAPNPSLARIAQRRGFPFAILGVEAHLPGTTSFVPDYEGAARLAFGHLAKAGHRNIAIVGGPFGSPDSRIAELSRALGNASAEMRLTIDAHNIFQGDLSFESGGAALDALNGRAPAPTAIIALSEAAGCGVAARASAKGIAIPQKLSVLTFADHAGLPPSGVPLTTVAIMAEDIAAAAVAEVGRQLQEGVPRSAQRVTCGAKLCDRASIAPRK